MRLNGARGKGSTFRELSRNYPPVTLENPFLFRELSDLLHDGLPGETKFAWHFLAAKEMRAEKRRTEF